MAIAFKILEKAQQEFDDSVVWYELKSEGLGKRFAAIVQQKFSLIEKYPERYPV